MSCLTRVALVLGLGILMLFIVGLLVAGYISNST